MDNFCIKPVIILVTPQIADNIGAVARIMTNFALEDLRIINPRDGWPNRKAEIVASRGKELIKKAKIFNDLKQALEGIDEVFACSARDRKMNKPFYNIKEHIADIKENYDNESKIAIMFGSERCGLLNEEIIYANKIIQITANQNYPVLNLSHAVGITCHEYFNLQKFKKKTLKYKAKQNSPADLSYYLDDLETKLEIAGYFDTEQRQKKLFQNVSNIYTRMNLSGQEIKSLMGISKALFLHDTKK